MSKSESLDFLRVLQSFNTLTRDELNLRGIDEWTHYRMIHSWLALMYPAAVKLGTSSVFVRD